MTVIDFDLSDRAFWALPHDQRERAFRQLRALDAPVFYEEPEVPFAPKGPGYYALVHHADVVAASRNPKVFASGRGGAISVPDLPEDFAEYFGSMINMDDPRHARLRRIVNRAFTPATVAQLTGNVRTVAEQITEELLAAGPGGDFVTTAAARLPLKIICDLMGLPESEYGFVLEHSNTILGGFDPEYGSADLAETGMMLLNAGMQLQQLVQDIAVRRERAPTDDLTSALVHANVDGERLTLQELGSFFILLLVAGNETTRHSITAGLRLLTVNPDQRALLTSDLDTLAPGAVEEIVRVTSPVIFMRRKLTQDHELNGQQYREGDKVVLFYNSANVDEAVFTDPYRFDITRSPNPHLGFGAAGPHFCLGAHLARLEITEMLCVLLRRIPTIEGGEPVYLYSNFINGVKHMPYTF
ncbi:methyl-branched lipid omega-hydroxylase [Virgisporangium aliadipatigenens]|uniref:Methyl-branched lipid omega-hydroxylase n=1 Tax=Virgisporangium aliadipatigenens TaxID=741659 RepID=A0A8J3YLS0_9ACTN|nr:cytochrome P450 [Virgisporangium aliadipatigenens]GIJ46742.1 methyl-branched lipid omega-hydroxylase [Virgisporangium aliadipatigenens]